MYVYIELSEIDEHHSQHYHDLYSGMLKLYQQEGMKHIMPYTHTINE